MPACDAGDWFQESYPWRFTPARLPLPPASTRVVILHPRRIVPASRLLFQITLFWPGCDTIIALPLRPTGRHYFKPHYRGLNGWRDCGRIKWTWGRERWEIQLHFVVSIRYGVIWTWGGRVSNSTNSQAESTHACFGGYVWFVCFTILLRNIAVEHLQQK